MARQSSIILTKEDKKAKLAELSAGIKQGKSIIKNIGVAVKDNDKELAAHTKVHAAEKKQLDKDLASAEKNLATLEAQKSALQNDPSSVATAAPVEKPKRTRRTKAEMEAARAAAA